MRFVLPVIIALTFLLAGCWSECPVAPDTGNSQKMWLNVESKNPLKVEQQIIISKIINGAEGGVIEYSLNLNGIEITGALVIPPNAFTGTLEISTTFDEENTTFIFEPSNTQFNIPLNLTIQYSGIDLSGINPSLIDFYYIDNSSNYAKADYGKLYVKPGKQELKVVDAVIDHFSRYGFAK